MIVVDTNVMVQFVMKGPHSIDADLLMDLDPEWAAPRILMIELRNVLLGFVRRGTINAEEAKTMNAGAAGILENRVFSVPGSQVFDAAMECDLSAYDAEFVALARLLGAQLATLDKAILRGATDVALSLKAIVSHPIQQSAIVSGGT